MATTARVTCPAAMAAWTFIQLAEDLLLQGKRASRCGKL